MSREQNALYMRILQTMQDSDYGLCAVDTDALFEICEQVEAENERLRALVDEATPSVKFYEPGASDWLERAKKAVD